MPENAYFKPLSGICRHTINVIKLTMGKKTLIPCRKRSIKSEASIHGFAIELIMFLLH